MALTDVRRLVDGLRPPALDELGLVEAVRQQARASRQVARAGTPAISVEARPQPLPELTAAVEVAAYPDRPRSAHERGAPRLRDHVPRALDATGEGTLQLEVVDDGQGLPSVPVPGVGLESMRERAEELGGTFVVEAGAVGGTRVVARLPLASVPRPASRSVAVPESADPRPGRSAGA